MKQEISISEEKLNEIIEQAVKKGLEEYIVEQEKKQKKKKNRYHDTYALMKCYRDAAFHVENAVSEASQMAAEYANEKEEIYLRSVRRTRFRTMIIKSHIDRAVDEIKRRRTAEGREEEYRAFEMYFMEGVSYEQIAEELETGVNTPRRWVKGILKELSVLLWGLDTDG
mgnify:CR=1 FL=1